MMTHETRKKGGKGARDRREVGVIQATEQSEATEAERAFIGTLEHEWDQGGETRGHCRRSIRACYVRSDDRHLSLCDEGNTPCFIIAANGLEALASASAASAAAGCRSRSAPAASGGTRRRDDWRRAGIVAILAIATAVIAAAIVAAAALATAALV